MGEAGETAGRVEMILSDLRIVVLAVIQVLISLCCC